MTLLLPIAAVATALAVAGMGAAASPDRLAQVARVPATGSGRAVLARAVAAAGWRAGAAGASVAAGVSLRSWVAAALVLAAAVVVQAFRRRAQQGREAARCRATVIEVCSALSAELQAGRSPAEALQWAVTGDPAAAGLLGGPVRAAVMGADVPRALTEAAAVEGAESLRRVAACWSIAQANGASFALGLDRLVGALRQEDAIRREVAAQLSSPRATAKLLAGLPLVALFLAAGTGADPLQVLLHTALGVACLVVGFSLAVAGLWWSESLARNVERRL